MTIIPGGVPGYTPDASLYTAAIPTRHPKKNYLVFPDRPEFTPNLTPEQILRAGAFGGTYFRTISSRVTKKRYVDAHREFPAEWFAGLNLKRVITSVTYDVSVNKFGVKCGQDLDAWESSGWITEDAPFGWFHWYCRFYLGRRSWDDDRQISRWVGVAGPKGRWKSNLIAKCVAAGRPHDDASISPVVRQTLLHWAYELNKEDHGECESPYYRHRGLSLLLWAYGNSLAPLPNRRCVCEGVQVHWESAIHSRVVQLKRRGRQVSPARPGVCCPRLRDRLKCGCCRCAGKSAGGVGQSCHTTFNWHMLLSGLPVPVRLRDSPPSPGLRLWPRYESLTTAYYCSNDAKGLLRPT